MGVIVTQFIIGYSTAYQIQLPVCASVSSFHVNDAPGGIFAPGRSRISLMQRRFYRMELWQSGAMERNSCPQLIIPICVQSRLSPGKFIISVHYRFWNYTDTLSTLSLYFENQYNDADSR